MGYSFEPGRMVYVVSPWRVHNSGEMDGGKLYWKISHLPFSTELANDASAAIFENIYDAEEYCRELNVMGKLLGTLY